MNVFWANRPVGRTGTMPWYVACASSSSPSRSAFLHPHAGAHVDGPVMTGRDPTAVKYLMFLLAIAQDDAVADAPEVRRPPVHERVMQWNDRREGLVQAL